MPDHVVGSREKCLHCQTVVRYEAPLNYAGQSLVFARGEHIELYLAQCPQCGRLILSIENRVLDGDEVIIDSGERVIWPLSSGRPPVPPEVPAKLAGDYSEAALVLPLSPKASAALSRRCLQTLLWEAAGAMSKNLSYQIDEVLQSKALPSFVAGNLDVVRQIGNFAAHEQKSETTGAVLDVELGEAEWNLDVLDALFDFYYVTPEIERRKREALNEKLREAGKPPLKEP